MAVKCVLEFFWRENKVFKDVSFSKNAILIILVHIFVILRFYINYIIHK